MRFTAHVLALLPLALASPVSVPNDNAKPIPGKYIVVMKPQTSQAQSVSAAMQEVVKEHVYDLRSFKGFSAALTDAQVTALKADGSVDYVVQDSRMKITQATTAVTQTGATWGLGRISHRAGGSRDYVYDSSAGAGTCSYIIDTGITPNHPDFGGRASIARVFEQGDGTDVDMNGHGTHVAGTIGSTTYGVAKRTKLRGVKVCDAGGYCTLSNVIAAVNFVPQDAESQGCSNGVVVNISLGATNEEWGPLRQIVAQAVARGIFVAVAAGNENDDAGKYSPASEPTACTVGATDNSDAIATFSNYGSFVDIFAPGVNVNSLWLRGGTNSLSGTSMSSPHIAGLGAYLLALEGSRSPTALCKRMQDLSTKNVISGLPANTVNYLAFNGVAS